jgi:prepilin-type N-terminal cleavage/methylation domain-containing protein
VRAGERGFTLTETAVALAITALLLLAGGIWMLGSHPAELAQTAADYDAAMASARALASTSGNGATLVFAPRPSLGSGSAGFTLRVYSGRPSPGGAVFPTAIMPLTASIAVTERTLGDPPFSIFVGASGDVSGAPHYPSFDSHGRARFAVIAREPECPHHGFLLTFAAAPGRSERRALPCVAVARGIPAPPNPSPTPNRPASAPAALIYHWPAAAPQSFVVTEWGYTHWFATTTGFACGDGTATYPNVLPSPYSPAFSPAEASAAPSPPPQTPYSYPNSGGGSMNDAPAAFPLDPAAAGLCSASVADDYGQVAQTPVQVMGWLTAAYAGKTYVRGTKPPLALPASAFPHRGATATIGVSKTYDAEPLQPAVAFDAACSPYVAFGVRPGMTPPKPMRQPATATVTLKLVNVPQSKIDCGGTIYDQYRGSLQGEGIPFNATIGASPCPNTGNAQTGPRDGVCYDLYFIGTGMTQSGGWTEESEVGLYVAHATDGDALYRWVVDGGTCTVQNLIGTDFATWSVLLGNGNTTPPPLATPQPIPNPAGFGLPAIPDAVDVTAAPDPKPTIPPPFLCRGP